MLRLITRAQWEARPPKSRSVGKLTKASTVHWNGNVVTVYGKKEWDHSNCASLIRGVQNFHMNSRGYADIGYNFVVCPHGYTYEGRGLNVVNAANGTNTGNRNSHAICALAGEGNPFKMEEKNGIRATVKHIADRANAVDMCIGHRDHKATACPGDERYKWVHAGMPVSQISNPKVGGNVVNGASRAQGGYALVSSKGEVFTHDGAPYFGDLSNAKVNGPIVSLTWNLEGDGYWLMGADGGVFALGAAKFRGAYPGFPKEVRNDPNRKFVAIVTRSDGGYTLVSSTQERYDL